MRKFIALQDIPMYLRTLAVLAVLLTASVQAPSGWQPADQHAGVDAEQTDRERAERISPSPGRPVAH